MDELLPDWIERSKIRGDIDPAPAIEEAIRTVEAQSTERWTIASNTIAKQLGVFPHKLKLPDKQELGTLFFLQVRENVEAALG